MSDSIAGTVTAMICVVVGLLIIGCALVPVVEQASGTKTTETVTGSNPYSSDVQLSTEVTDDYTMMLADGSVTVNGKQMQGTLYLQNNYDFMEGAVNSIFTISSERITVKQEDGVSSISLNSGTATITPTQIIVTGKEYSHPDRDYSVTHALNDAAIVTSNQSDLVQVAPSDKIFTMMNSATIGDGQTMTLFYGDFDNPSIATITTQTAASPTSAATLTKNANGTVTVSIDNEQGTIYAPIGWSQTVTTFEDSQYAPLYAIIPIMCILGMAYVLIRRF